jgi:hypothetical protein
LPFRRNEASAQALTRPHRLTVRTPGFHPGNRGSIPLEVTNESHPLRVGVFHWWFLCGETNRTLVRAPMRLTQELAPSKPTAYSLKANLPLEVTI